tara:strand:- start:248 stop:481 length:234 start_codon:yes stop_codon:yes gene_type:complete
MSDKKKKTCPYEQVTGKIDTIDKKLIETISELKNLTKRMEENPDVCPDVEDSEKALQEALDTYFINDLLKQKPVGDA